MFLDTVLVESVFRTNLVKSSRANTFPYIFQVKLNLGELTVLI